MYVILTLGSWTTQDCPAPEAFFIAAAVWFGLNIVISGYILTMLLRMLLNTCIILQPESSHSHLPSAGIIGVHHYLMVYVVLGMELPAC